MSNLVVRDGRDEWLTLKEEATTFLKSGFLPAHVKTPEQAIAIAMVGRELGITPWRALVGITVIQGKPTLSAELMLSLIKQHEGRDAIVFKETTDLVATAIYRGKHSTESREYSYTWEMAKRAGLTSGANWQKHPANMLRARCISNVARMAFPDIIAGCYSEDEGEEIAAGRAQASSLRIVPESPVNPQETYRPLPSTPEVPQLRQVNEVTGEIIDATPEPEPEPVPEENLPAPSAWIVALRGLVEQLAQFGVHEELPAGTLTRGQARVIKAALIDTLAEAKQQAEESPL